ncbi:MAG TPA: ABC transporter substrate-binding protein [Alphaproteobacteria bacterium]|nr:ABC transporter substrate-binding protein [Alphaproteobacteria bacterium]
MTRFLALLRFTLPLLALLCAPVVGTATAGAPQPAKVTPQGKVVLAWHTGISSVWLDPQEQAAMLTPTNFQYALHDALVKNYRDRFADPALAESFDIAKDFKSATVVLRQGIKFHNGDPVTPEDVKFTYENYRGAQADVLKDKTERIEIVDDRTVRFHFKEPFLDFEVLYGTSATGAGWIVPAKYYQQVGPDGFKQKPIGAGPYKLVRQEPGIRLEFEAFEDYYRPVHVKQLIMVSVPEASTRVAMIERGEADIMYLVPGELIEHVKNLRGVQLAPTLGGPWWLEFPGFEDPNNPFHDKRVRQAVSYALNRQALSQAETAGFSPPLGNWIPDDWPGAIKWPAFEYDLAKAKQLMAEAGHGSGFQVDWLTPLPPYFSMGERIISQLLQIGIRARLQTMERGTFFKNLQGGREAFPGTQILLNISGSPGDWAGRYRAYFQCGGFSSRTCVKELDAKFEQYERSVDPAERKTLAEEIQRGILENYYFVPVYRLAFINAIGPKIAASKWEEVFPTVQSVYAYPWEEIRLKK